MTKTRQVAVVILGLGFVLTFVGYAASGQSQKKTPLTNEDVIQMVKAQFTDSTVVKAIEANDTAFDVSASALIHLKDSGVSQTVMEAILSAATPKGTSSTKHAGATEENERPELGPPTSVYADKWKMAEIKECSTYANHPFLLFCDEEKLAWPNSLFSLLSTYRQLGAGSHEDAYRQAISYETVASYSPMNLPKNQTLWKCSKDSNGITCNFSGTQDPLLEKKKSVQ